MSPYKPFFLFFLECLLLWCGTCLILICDPSVDHFLRSEGSGSGESESDFLLPSFYHHGKYPLPPSLLPELLLTFIHLHFMSVKIVSNPGNSYFKRAVQWQLDFLSLKT